jgi:hypothetical protein
MRQTSADLAGEAIEIMQHVTSEVPRLHGPHQANSTGTASDLRSLPSFETASKPTRRRRGPETGDQGNCTSESLL